MVITAFVMFFLVTGASGVGKSTVRRLIASEFANVLDAVIETSERGPKEVANLVARWLRQHLQD